MDATSSKPGATRQWWSVARLVGSEAPLIWMPGASYYEVQTWAGAELELRLEEMVIRPIWVGHIPPDKSKNPRKLRADYEALRLAREARGKP